MNYVLSAGRIHEIKHDGFRIMARRDGAAGRLITRAGNEFFWRFPSIAIAVAKLPVQSCLINGEAHDDGEGEIVFKHACRLGCEGIVSKRIGSQYKSGRSAHWIKVKNPAAPAVRREAEEDWS